MTLALKVVKSTTKVEVSLVVPNQRNCWWRALRLDLTPPPSIVAFRTCMRNSLEDQAATTISTRMPSLKESLYRKDAMKPALFHTTVESFLLIV